MVTVKHYLYLGSHDSSVYDAKNYHFNLRLRCDPLLEAKTKLFYQEVPRSLLNVHQHQKTQILFKMLILKSMERH